MKVVLALGDQAFHDLPGRFGQLEPEEQLVDGEDFYLDVLGERDGVAGAGKVLQVNEEVDSDREDLFLDRLPEAEDIFPAGQGFVKGQFPGLKFPVQGLDHPPDPILVLHLHPHQPEIEAAQFFPRLLFSQEPVELHPAPLQPQGELQ